MTGSQNKVPKPRQPCASTTLTGGLCQNHPVRGKARCRMYGDASTGPRTAEGRERIAAAHFKHGRRRRSVIAEQIRRNRIGREINTEIAEIEREAIVRGWLAKDWKELI
mgnify:CR=1 FL=1